MKTVLLVNLGTPDSPKPLAVWRYLTEFLTDPRVIELPFWKRQLLVRGLIVPFRFRESAKNYQKIWTPSGSPLKTTSEKLAALVQERVGLPVRLAMRYGSPSIRDVLEKITGEVIVVPLFPQYAEATTGSVIACVRSCRPDAQFCLLDPAHPTMIKAMAAQVKEPFDHLVMSFHGIPVSQDRHGYKEACYRTAAALGKELGSAYTVSFQSRLGKDPWLEPYTHELLPTLSGKVALMSPSFVADCLETIYELGMEYRSLYEGPLISCMNTDLLWVQALCEQLEIHCLSCSGVMPSPARRLSSIR